MGRDSLQLGPLEMDVLGLLDGADPASVKDVAAKLRAKGKKLAYTTVMTILVRLHEKGLVTRAKDGRLYLYTAARRSEKVRKGLWSTVYQSLFQNDRLKPILSLIDETADLTADELGELRRMVDAKISELEGPSQDAKGTKA